MQLAGAIWPLVAGVIVGAVGLSLALFGLLIFTEKDKIPDSKLSPCFGPIVGAVGLIMVGAFVFLAHFGLVRLRDWLY
ncbi:MAG: hypothetical protein AAB499_00630 [Patescibacteria group bacterium]